MKHLFLLVTALFFFSGASKLIAQNSAVFDQHQAFNPNLMTYPESPYRSASGIPAANYWQNKADYQIKAELDTTNHEIKASVILTRNNFV